MVPWVLVVAAVLVARAAPRAAPDQTGAVAGRESPGLLLLLVVAAVAQAVAGQEAGLPPGPQEGWPGGGGIARAFALLLPALLLALHLTKPNQELQ
jgi:hypothetical protein